MNTRRLISAMYFVVFFAFALCDNASAENDGDWCSNVKVLGAGASSTSKLIYVRNQRSDCGSEWPLNTQRWFVLDDSGSNASAMLAAALTAEATGRTIVIIGKDRLFNEMNVLVQVTTLE